MLHAQTQWRSNSWTMQPLKDIKLPTINHALDWSCPKWTLANANAQFGLNNAQCSSSTTTTIIQEAPPPTLMTPCHLMVTTPNTVTVHSKLSPPLTFTDTHPRCHVAVSNMATKWWTMNASFIVNRWALPSQPNPPNLTYQQTTAHNNNYMTMASSEMFNANNNLRPPGCHDHPNSDKCPKMNKTTQTMMDTTKWTRTDAHTQKQLPPHMKTTTTT